MFLNDPVQTFPAENSLISSHRTQNPPPARAGVHTRNQPGGRGRGAARGAVLAPGRLSHNSAVLFAQQLCGQTVGAGRLDIVRYVLSVGQVTQWQGQLLQHWQ